MSQVQSGILPEHCRAAIWIEANVVGDKNALREGCRVFIDKLATLQAKFPDAALGAVVAFGHDIWRELSGGEGAQELKNFTPLGKVWRLPHSSTCLSISSLCVTTSISPSRRRRWPRLATPLT